MASTIWTTALTQLTFMTANDTDHPLGRHRRTTLVSSLNKLTLLNVVKNFIRLWSDQSVEKKLSYAEI